MDLTILHQHEEGICALLSYAASDPWVREHFPERPVLPASLILAAFLHLARKLSVPCPTVRRLRCLAPLPPGAHPLELRRHGLLLHGRIHGQDGTALTTVVLEA